MSGKIYVAHDALSGLLDDLSKKFRVWIPQMMDQASGHIAFGVYAPGKKPELTRRSRLSPKKILFPSTDTLFKFTHVKDPKDPVRYTIDLKESFDNGPTLVFGARPCDTRGFLTFDQVFLKGQYKDVYYERRRQNTLFATLVCQDSDTACFCSSVGSGPADMTGSDMAVIPIEGGYVIEGLTDAGRKLVEASGSAPSPEQAAEAEQIKQKTAAMKVGEDDLTGYADDLTRRFTDMDFWREQVSPCITCGICTWVCPTCYCFSITDEASGMSGERMRSWDSCMFYLYTLEARGHNPRPTKMERYRNRVGHKFSYFPKKYDGMVSCCGCGRCIRTCPVSIDIRKVVKELKETADDRA
ncbi:MAG: 4Fe-4S dicluster domain-containing protein [Desulfobacterales bacterium]|nr:4Fe-4S dicluster domain-containing protein [Desulfobacterales bacterium]